jgi:AcrR family transcriptional regulator
VPKVSRAHLDARRRQILAAAVDCFARDGFHRTTMQDVVRRAGLSPGAIYRYFASKDDIIEAIAAERHEREVVRIAAACAAEHPGPALDALARDLFAPLRRRDERTERRIGVQIWAEALRDPRILALVRRGVDRPRKLLGDFVRGAQRRGALAPQVDADAVARVMIALFQGFVLQQAWDPTARVDAYVDVIRALVAGLTDGTPPPRDPRTRARGAGGAPRGAGPRSPARAPGARAAARARARRPT